MAVTITGNDGVVFTFEDGEVDDINAEITTGSEQYAQYFGGPADAWVFEGDGPTKIISVTGMLYETSTTRTSSGTTTTVNEQREWLEKQFVGGQLPRSFSSNYTGTTYSVTSGTFVPTTVLAGRCSFRESTGNVNVLQFSMYLLVGGQ